MSASNREGRTANLVFRASSYSGTSGNCVEVADLPTGAAVRDSKAPEAGHLTFPLPEWHAFLIEVKSDHL